MRDVLLTSVFAVLLFHALRETWVGALLWTWFSLMNPHRLTYGFAYSLPFAMVTAIATLLSILWSRGKVRLPRDWSVLMLFLFVTWTTITTVAAIYPERSADILLTTAKIQLMTLVCMASLRERKHIELFVWVNVISLGFYGVKGGIFAIGSGGSSRVWGPASSYIEDNNALGLALVMAIPLMNYLRLVSVQRWLKGTLMVAMILTAIAVLSTQSRGALLAISAMALLLMFRSKNKLAAALIIVVAAVMLVAFMPASWEARMATIGTYQEDTSAMQRINSWTNAFNVANDRLTGAGFAITSADIFARYSPRPEWVLTAHSIYFQVLGEHGWIGLVLFLSMGALALRDGAWIRKRALERPETYWLHDLAGMVQVTMVGYAVGGAFLSLAYFDLPYNMMVILVCSKHWLREERWKTEKVGAFGAQSSRGAAPAEAPPGLVLPQR